jgi:hypothetical protein
MESEQTMTSFTAAVATRIVAENGTMCMNFEAGQTRPVHKVLYRAALAAGLMPEGTMPELEPEPVKLPSQEEMIEEGLVEACQTLIMRGNPADFTQLGKPRAASLKKLVDFDFKATDAERAFSIAMFKVEQDADDSTERPEPSSGATE